MKNFLISSLIAVCYSCTSKKQVQPIEQKVDTTKTQSISINTISIKNENEVKIKDTNIYATKNTVKIENMSSITPSVKVKEKTPKASEVHKNISKHTNIVKNETPVEKIISPKKTLLTKKITPENPIISKKVKKEIIISKPNHELWNTLTKSNVSNNGKVNYKGFKSNLTKVSDYLKILEKVPPQKNWSKNEKLAYWFNLYNASTVYLIASNYPVKSIKVINGGKPWDKKFIKSGNNTFSLNEIENVIVRPNYDEPRLHVAFNCAAASCPNLLNEAFEANKLNSQLNTLAKKWINDSTKNQISENNIAISQIFNWYKVDFKDGVIPFINTYSSKTKINSNATITYLEYDWKLNE